MNRKGACMCGAVVFEAKQTSAEVSACHCGMCRRWSGGVWMGVATEGIEWQRDETLKTLKSSEWAERGFCSACGSSLFYRVTAEGKHQGMTSVGLGCLEDTSGLELAREWFIDIKPECYAFEGERIRVTEAEVFAMFQG